MFCHGRPEMSSDLDGFAGRRGASVFMIQPRQADVSAQPTGKALSRIGKLSPLPPVRSGKRSGYQAIFEAS
jgi:hypothetical protein